jgi:1,2-diacylglycerol 3-alpha-glucosyltransferase
MKILISSLTYPLPNGVTVSVNTAMDGFLKRNHSVRIIAPDYKIKKIREEHLTVKSSFLARSIGVIIGKEERTFGLGAQSQIKKIINEFNPDAFWLHSLTWSVNAFEREMMKHKKPKVLFYHTLVEEYGRLYAGKIGALTMRKRSKDVCNKVDVVMTPSNAMKKKLENYGVTKPIHVVPTGIDPCLNPFTKKELIEKFKIPPESKILLYVGRVSKEKNLNVLLNAIKEIDEKKLKAFLLIVGPGDVDEIKKDIDKMKIKDKVFLTGALPKEETARVYGASDAFVFSSTTETQGLVIGEAMNAEIPVIALDSSIQKEVYPVETAIVINDPKDFPEKIIDVFENNEKTKKMIQNAKKFVELNFTKKIMIDRQIKIFNSLIK